MKAHHEKIGSRRSSEQIPESFYNEDLDDLTTNMLRELGTFANAGGRIIGRKLEGYDEFLNKPYTWIAYVDEKEQPVSRGDYSVYENRLTISTLKALVRRKLIRVTDPVPCYRQDKPLAFETNERGLAIGQWVVKVGVKSFQHWIDEHP